MITGVRIWSGSSGKASISPGVHSKCAEDEPGILANTAQALAFFGEDIDAMITLVDRALALNPSFARGWYISGILRLWAGQPDMAIEHLETSLRLSPRARVGPAFVAIGAAHLISRRFAEAVPKLAPRDPGGPKRSGSIPPARRLLRAYGTAQRSASRSSSGCGHSPLISCPARSFLNREHRELLLSGLRLAAGEAP